MIKLYFAFFLLIFSSIYFGMHYYVFYKISSGLNLPGNRLLFLKIFICAGAVLFFAGEILTRRYSLGFVKPIAFIGSNWLGVISISVFIFALSDLLRLFIKQANFNYYSTMAAIALIVIISVYSLYNGFQRPKVKELKVPIQKLNRQHSGFTIVQLTDIHLNLSKPSNYLEYIVKKTNSLSPDLVVITGDLIDADLCGLDNFCEILSRINAKHGVYAVTGNHEYYAGLGTFKKIAELSGIKLLMNKTITLDNIIYLSGINDTESRRFDPTSNDLKNYFDSLKNKTDLPIILLSHRPSIFDIARKNGVDLQLSGHTHYGQIPPSDIIVALFLKYSWGLYEKNGSYIYTSPGTSTWGPQMRLFSKNEITKIVLESK